MADAVTKESPQKEKLETKPMQDYSALDGFGLDIAKLRREAIDGRRLLGIEDDWVEDDEFYVGIDNANRHEHRTAHKTLKPSAVGSWSTEDVKNSRGATKSTVFINITRPYVDAAAARISDMLLPSDDKCWGIEPTPIPDLDDAMESEALINLADDLTNISEADFAKAIMDVANKRAGAAETRIEDWFEEGKWKNKSRNIIHKSAKLGTGIIKGPVPVRKRSIKWAWDQEQYRSVKQISSDIKPESKEVDPYNAFPDPVCGDDIQDGNYFFERDYMTERRVRDLQGQPGYIDSQIDACIAEGPIAPEMDWNPNEQLQGTVDRKNGLYEIWYYTGMVEIDKMEEAGCDCSKFRQNGEIHISAVVTMINHRVVKAVKNPLDDGSFNYDFLIWQKHPGMPWGIGVSRQMRESQRMLNASVRNMMDNAALSNGPQVVIDTDVIYPIDGQWEITPRKAWGKKQGSSVQDIRNAFQVFDIKCHQQELLAIIEFSLRMAEESTGLPMILQGQMGEKAPDTLGGMNMLQNNASSVLRRLAKNFDEVTVNHVTRYYHWLMEYGEDDYEKGDFSISARGSSTLVERDLQNQELAMIVDLSKLPQYGLDPEKSVEEYLRSRHFDPKQFKPAPGEQAKNAEPMDPRIQAAAINAETKAAEREHESDENKRNRDARLEEKLLDINNDNARFNAEVAVKEDMGSGI